MRLLVGGQTNREIAEALEVSIRTVDRHVGNIYDQIGARSRVEATARALAREID